MITEKDMQYILTIANYGNLTKAADALFLSQPALSIHLKQLENRAVIAWRGAASAGLVSSADRGI